MTGFSSSFRAIGSGKTTPSSNSSRPTSPVSGIRWSYTTREAAAGEVDGKDYHFLDETAFRQMIDKNEFVEWAYVYGNLYGTPRKELTEQIKQGIDVSRNRRAGCPLGEKEV